jgi:hypothetical protein
MRWRTFFLWNAAGGICWATSVGLLVYFGGKAVEGAIQKVGVYGAVAAAVILLGVYLVHRRRHHPTAAPTPPSGPPDSDELLGKGRTDRQPQTPPEAAAPGETRSQ